MLARAPARNERPKFHPSRLRGCPLWVSKRHTQCSKLELIESPSSGGRRFAERSLWNIDVATLGLLGFDVSRPDYISPLLHIVNQESSEVGLRQRQWDVSEAVDASLNFWI